MPQGSEYHHFIPRLLLENFASFKNPGKIVPKTSKTKKGPPKPQKLTILDLEAGELKQGKVGDTFGIVDLYREFDNADGEQQILEKRLSALEGAASKILKTVKDRYDAGMGEVQLIRKDKDLLRRFLFIMMYRNSTFARRFDKAREDYNADDREQMLAYMDEKGYRNPRDVWFANIRAFLEVDMAKDVEDLFTELKKRAYQMDADWFLSLIQGSFLAFCTPKNAADEFLLTQNAYSVFEGPSSAGKYTEYHRFAPVTPKVIVVLRSRLLPHAGQGATNDTMQILLERTKQVHLNPDAAGSWLEDLPVAVAGNNYSQVVNGKVEHVPTKMSKDKHIFYFPFFPIDHEHVQKINMICLEQAFETAAIIYKSPESLRTALDFYLTDKTPGFKLVLRARPNGPHSLGTMLQQDEHLSRSRTEDKFLTYLQLLHSFARQLGSRVELDYNRVD